MINKTLHIISFDNPYPPVYGGVIDVFYKLKYFKELGYQIILHVYTADVIVSKELNELCIKVYFYKRKKQWYNHFSLLPFVAVSRFDKAIINNLKKDDHPVLFEGLHTTLPLVKNDFKNRKLYLRAHNVEHNYYKGLAKSEPSILNKIIFTIESYKLEMYEKKILPKINVILPISNYEYLYFKKEYDIETVLLPVFHQNSKVIKLGVRGEYALYQGDLRISDNKRVVAKLINMFNDIDYSLVIASNIRKDEFKKMYPNISGNIMYEKIKGNTHLLSLFNGAHINTVFSYQNSGTKLKLINALYNSRFCLINDNMIDEESIKKVCDVENDLLKYKERIKTLIAKDYNLSEERVLVLRNFVNQNKLILQKIF
ncbi:MAG: hypothetical protein HRT69_03950 [Flavobacteriaceae bacterium]|nr:hypothetical protein [Flavobacteriaceae bacterium]